MVIAEYLDHFPISSYQQPVISGWISQADWGNSTFLLTTFLALKLFPTRDFLYFFIDNTARDMNTLCFLSSLDMIQGELLRNRDKKEKFIPVCLDHCSLEILPSIHLLLQTYNIPSKIDDLVIELLGKTRRQPDTNWPLLGFDDENYSVAKRNLEQAINKMKKNHDRRCQKNFSEFTKKRQCLRGTSTV